MALGNNVTVSTEQVEQIATNIETLNKQLAEKLQESKEAVDGLANVWTGEAATETIESFAAFAGKYFETYEEVIRNYVQFLRVNVAQGYEETETKNTTLAGNLKA